MYVVDSCVWIEYFSNGDRADIAEMLLKGSVIVPAAVLYEVHKFAVNVQGREAGRAVQATMIARSARGIEAFNEVIAVEASRIWQNERPKSGKRIAALDSHILAHARHEHLPLATFDADLEGLAGVSYWPVKDRRLYTPDPIWPP